MNLMSVVKKINAFLATHPGGLGCVPHCGVVCCYTRHRLHHISLVHPAAIVVLEGTKTLFRADESLRVQPGSMFMLPQQMRVGIESDPSPKTGRYLALRLSFPEEIVARVLARDNSRHCPAPTSLGGLLVEVDRHVELVLGHILDLACCSPDNASLMELYLQALLILLSERSPALPLLWDRAVTWRSRASSLIGHEPARCWSAREVAGKLATSERSLRRNLENEGTSLRQIFLDVRLGAALALLQGGGVTVGWAAQRCGFNSASRFAARFKERFGANPSDILRFGAVAGQHLAE